ncbi:MAG: DUF4097 family beta strand repeat-containing protein [Bacteroidota bacterium]
MKQMIKIALLLIIPVGGALAQKQTLTIPLSSPGEQGRLMIDVTNGGMEVQAYDGTEVLISAIPADEHMTKINSDCDDCPKFKDKGKWKDDRDNRDEKAQGMRKISSNPIELEATENNNVVEIETNSWKRGIYLEVKVPRNFDLQLSTVNQGDIRITGVSGNMDVNNVNGNIKLIDISGSVLSNTVNGDIEATFESVQNDEPMAFTTLNGDVDVTFPTGIKATAKMKSERGEIFSDFDMNIRQSEPKTSREGREFKIEINAWVYGEINGGGPEYKMQNMNGNIYVRKP